MAEKIQIELVQQNLDISIVKQNLAPSFPAFVQILGDVFSRDGKSAYESAVENGFIGTVGQWLDSLVGGPGPQGPAGLSAYQVALANGFVGTESEWLNFLQGVDGDDGREVEIRNSGTHIQWRYVGDVSWINIVSISALKGDTGASIELQVTATHIQWRVVGAPTWINLVALSEIKGDPGTTTWGGITDKPLTFTPSVHGHAISDITGLVSALAGKSNVGHTHDIENINGLRDELDSKSNVGHTHDYNTLDNLPTIPDVIINNPEIHTDFSGTEISILYDPLSLVKVYRNGQLLTEGVDRNIFGRDITFEYELTEDIITLSYDHI